MRSVTVERKQMNFWAKKAYRESQVVILFLSLSFITALLFYLETKELLWIHFLSRFQSLTTTGFLQAIYRYECVVNKDFLIVNMILADLKLLVAIASFIENKKIKTRGTEYLKALT